MADVKHVIYALGANIAVAEAIAAVCPRGHTMQVRDGFFFSAAANQREEGLAIDKAHVLCIDVDSKTAAETALISAVDAVYTDSTAFELFDTGEYLATAALLVQPDLATVLDPEGDPA